LEVFLKNVPVGTVIASRYTIRTIDAIDPLLQVGQLCFCK
jgi:hypothetical protein